jgi:hypothetical protein
MAPGIGSQPKIREGSFMDTTFQMIENLAVTNFQIFESIAVIIAAIAAIYGINSWRREMIGKVKFQLAEETLALFYEAEYRIWAIRYPVSLDKESQPPKATNSDENIPKESHGASNIIFNRMEAHREFFAKLHGLRFRFKTHFGKQSIKPFDELSVILNELLHAATKINILWRDKGNWSSDDWNKCFEVIWEGHGKPDIIARKVKDAVSLMESTCSPVLLREK